jgi:hypothetical protein
MEKIFISILLAFLYCCCDHLAHKNSILYIINYLPFTFICWWKFTLRYAKFVKYIFRICRPLVVFIFLVFPSEKSISIVLKISTLCLDCLWCIYFHILINFVSFFSLPYFTYCFYNKKKKPILDLLSAKLILRFADLVSYFFIVEYYFAIPIVFLLLLSELNCEFFLKAVFDNFNYFIFERIKFQMESKMKHESQYNNDEFYAIDSQVVFFHENGFKRSQTTLGTQSGKNSWTKLTEHILFMIYFT